MATIDINEQIRVIDESIAWLKENQKEVFEQRFLLLAQERCKLRKIAEAEKENPAIAAYGESQKGKSYLMGNLLQNNGAPFMVKAEGQEFNFVQSINPIGDGREATGVVTRFTAFAGQEGRYSAQYPVLMKLLTVKDLIIILLDGYFNDLIDYQTYSDSELNEKAEAVYQAYKEKPDVQHLLIEDDILSIKYYLQAFVEANSQTLWKSVFFEKLALVIRKVPKERWSQVLSVLWYDNEHLTNLFNRLCSCMERLSFSGEVYLPIEAVLHHGDNKNTIMSVDCLNGLFNNQSPLYTDVYIKGADGGFSVVSRFNKSELSAICAEVAYKVDAAYLDSEIKYKNVEEIPVETRTRLSEPFSRDLIQKSDLLDFPGARNRLQLKAEFLNKVDQADDTSNIVKILLRGKVAFLFNKYSDSKAINILMFCHDKANLNVTSMYRTLERWIKEYVGKNIEERQATVQKAGGIPPLFVICTKFNLDMVEESTPEKNSLSALTQRWDGRFSKVLYKDCFEAGNVEWFNNWTAKGETFKNTYMLRDFKYSGCDGSGNNLYEGYKETDPCPEERMLKLTPSFYENLRSSFIGNANVLQFFANPTKAWDVAASRNNDGSVYIIEQLTPVAKNLKGVREAQFASEQQKVAESVKDIMAPFHHSEKEEDLLAENLCKANRIIRELDFTCNNDNYYFGHLIQALQLTEKDTLQEVHRLIQSPELNDSVYNFSNYELIKKRCGKDLEQCGNEEEQWNCIVTTYGFRSKEEARDYLQSKNVDPKLLFSGEYKKKINSSMIANRVLEVWKAKLKSPQVSNLLSGEQSFDSIVMGDLIDNILLTAQSLSLEEHLDELIADYVNVVALHTVNESLVADLLASEINNFVSDLGYHYLDDKKVEQLRAQAQTQHWPLFSYIGKERQSVWNEEELTNLFKDLNVNPQAITPAFERNYYQWIEYMFISFVAQTQTGQFEREANHALSLILEKLN